MGLPEPSQHLPTDLGIKSKCFITACRTLCGLVLSYLFYVIASHFPPPSFVFHPHCLFRFLKTPSSFPPLGFFMSHSFFLDPSFPRPLSSGSQIPNPQKGLPWLSKLKQPPPPVIPYLLTLFHFLHSTYYYQKLSCFLVYPLFLPKTEASWGWNHIWLVLLCIPSI